MKPSGKERRDRDRDDDDRRPSKKGREKFVYRKRDPKKMQEHATQQGGDYDSYTKGDVKKFTPPEDRNRIRILPPTWEDADHYGFTVWVHGGIGTDRSSYLCAMKMKGDPCCICEGLAKASDAELVKEHRAKKRLLVYLVNRDKEKDGVMLWDMSWTIDRDISGLAIDEDNGGVLEIDNPDEGYDVSFTRTGQKLRTRYTNFKMARNPSPLSDDEDQQQEWLQVAIDNPLDGMLVFHDQEHIQAVFDGGLEAGSRDDEDEDERPRTRREKREKDEDEDERPARGSKSRSKDEDEDEDDPDKDVDADEDEDEDETPRGKGGASRTTTRGKSRGDEDEDEDGDAERAKDDDGDEDEENEPERPAKGVREKVRAGLRSRKAAEADPDEDEDDPS